MSEPIVLVVDDESNVVRLCQRVLERASFQVIPVTDSVQALAILAHQTVDLLLADIRMPGLDGFQLLAQARRHQPDLAAVITTGYGTVETAIMALQQGADGLILKPFANADLVQTVRRALDESKRKRDLMRLNTLRPLFDVTENLFSETNPRLLQDLIVEAVCGHVSCTISSLYQRKAAEENHRLMAWRGKPLTTAMAHQPGGLLDVALASTAPLWINCEGPGETSLQVLLAEYGLSSFLCAPITRKGSSIALLAARLAHEPLFQESDLEMFLILARQAVVALENAHLYAELRSYVQQVERSQHAMLQAEKMAAAGRLTASIAHEINNPLQSVNNCLHLADRKELNPAERQKYLDMAQMELSRLMTTVQRMLEFYRPGIRDRKSANLNELVDRVLMLLDPQLIKSNIKVNKKLSSNLPQVMIVANQIQQVLLNLIINAMEAMPGGGELLIETDRTNSSAFQSPENGAVTEGAGGVYILIEDTGPGIADSERERIFEPFVSTKESGTGLGLAVSYGIVTAHGGTLNLVNGRGRGACFRITLSEGEML